MSNFVVKPKKIMFNFFHKKEKVAAEMPMKTDIHCHIVPGVDDGSPDVETSVELVERLMGMGIKRIIASPHVTQDTFENTPETLDPALASLNAALKEKGIDIAVDRSSEYRIDEFFIEQLNAGNIRPYPGGFILVENSFMQEPWNLEQLLFDLKVKGFKPILAHPERYMYYSDKRNRSRYETLHNQGTFFQINMLSLADAYHGPEREVALWLLEKGYVDFIGTDLHNHHHADCLEAYLSSRHYGKIAAKLRETAKNDVWIK